MKTGLKTTEWDKFHKSLAKKLSTQALGQFTIETAGLINTTIKMRVQRDGVGSYGKMRSYSSWYASKKGATGRQTAFRDLTYSGKMFQALTETMIAPLTAKQYFMGSMENKKAEENESRTAFFSYTSKENEVLNDEIGKYFDFF